MQFLVQVGFGSASIVVDPAAFDFALFLPRLPVGGELLSAAIQSRLTVGQQRFGFFEILLAALKLGERRAKFAEYDFHFRRQSAMTGLMLNRIVWRIRRVTGIRLLAADELPHQIERQLDVPAELLGVGMELLEQAVLFFRAEQPCRPVLGSKLDTAFPRPVPALDLYGSEWTGGAILAAVPILDDELRVHRLVPAIAV